MRTRSTSDSASTHSEPRNDRLADVFDILLLARYTLCVSDELFPSGPWTGFYAYEPQDKHRMDLHLTFANGHMAGAGNDDLGAFTIKGRYDASNLECHWTKHYLGAHEVYYEGYREGKGIWGRWGINAFSHGGFHIWPQGTGSGASEYLETEEPVVHELALPHAAPAGPVPAGLRTDPQPDHSRTGSDQPK